MLGKLLGGIWKSLMKYTSKSHMQPIFAIPLVKQKMCTTNKQKIERANGNRTMKRRCSILS